MLNDLNDNKKIIYLLLSKIENYIYFCIVIELFFHFPIQDNMILFTFCWFIITEILF